MTATEQILSELAAIRQRLDCLLVPVAIQTGRQTATLDRDQIKADNKANRELAKRNAGMTGKRGK